MAIYEIIVSVNAIPWHAITHEMFDTKKNNGNMTKSGAWLILREMFHATLHVLPKDNEANFLNYGHSLSLEDKPFLYDISCKKGIDEYEMYLYYKSDTYEMKYRKIEKGNNASEIPMEQRTKHINLG